VRPPSRIAQGRKRAFCGKRAPAIIVVVAALLAAVPAGADQIGDKKAEAQRVLGEINQLDVRLGRAIEAYDASTIKLDHIRKELSTNRYEMRVALKNKARAEDRLARRLRELWISGQADPMVQVLTSANSLEDIIDRMDTANRVSAQDAQVLHQVRQYRREVAVRGTALRRAHRAQQRVVSARAAAKAEIENGLADRKRLLSSIKSEIQRLQAEEAARQALLAAQARARLVAQQQAAQARLNATVVGVTAQAPSPVVSTDSGSTDSTGATATTTGAVTTVAPPSQYGGVVGYAMQELGHAYVWGAAGPDVFDCSGLVVWAYGQMGVSLPHSSYSLWNMGVYVSRDQLQPGDLVFFDGLGHVGIYIGGGQFIHAPHTGDVVKISNLNEGWYAAEYVGARRIL
jgi:cell wall-associated NlpC family hydrolase